MTYIDYLNDFNQWLEQADNPTDKVIVLYYGLLNTFNRRGWPRWAGVDTQRLMILARTTDKKVAFRARDFLVKAGLLEYKPGRKGVATEYSLLTFGGKSTTENATPNKTKKKTKTEDDEDTRTREDEGLGRVMTEYMERIEPAPSPMSMSMLTHYVQMLGPEVCLRAIYRAIDAGVRKWPYIRAILQNCEKEGIRCLADWDKLEEERNGFKRNSERSAAETTGIAAKYNLKAHEL